ncbi:MAG: NapC/NirT family cytochrome c [Deltaproteobacteria bacterium]|nr:NapC/NirT family cytochrome c [Deltaproteobacteria bacterium]
MRHPLKYFPLLWTNWITIIGTIVTTVTGCFLVLAMTADLLSPLEPYLAAAIFMVGPMLFVSGLVIIPIGVAIEHRLARHRRTAEPHPLAISIRAAFEDRKIRSRATLIGFATLANIIIVAGSGVKIVSFMDTPSFCGQVCHKVMNPEFAAYERSAHSRVACVRCHIGPGASWAVRAKIDGLRQVWAVATNTYSRPIPSPVHTLRPARDTCEQCHWPAKFTGSRVALRTHYQDDEKNSPAVNALVLHIGGEDPRTHVYKGIHWHVSPDVEIRYEALDDKREHIGKVTRLDKGKVTAVFEPAGAGGPVKEERTLDCVDCHNRPSHAMDRSAAAALDRAFGEGLLDPRVPFLHAVAKKLLTRSDVDRGKAEDVFYEGLGEAYSSEHPQVKPSQGALRNAAKGLAGLYRANVFPDMGVKWGTYVNHLGHGGDEKDRRGCFRCHNEEHKTKDGKAISQDCGLCHDLLAMDESPDNLTEPLKGLMPQAQR